MKLGDLYKMIIFFGRDCDPRGKKSSISSFADTAILYGDPQKEIKNIMVGIDVDVAELLLADRLRQKEDVDVVISHHPQGKAYATLPEVMKLQLAVLIKAGITKKAAEGMLAERMRQVSRKISAANHMRVVDAARLLDLPFLCVHTPADNHVASYITSLMKKHKPKNLSDIIDILLEIPEYNNAHKANGGPYILLGNPRGSCGKIFIEMTGGTEGPVEAYEPLKKEGIRTIISMHLSEEHFKKIRQVNLNVIIAGHIASDTLGMNLLLDRIIKKENLKIIPISGFTRFIR